MSRTPRRHQMNRMAFRKSQPPGNGTLRGRVQPAQGISHRLGNIPSSGTNHVISGADNNYRASAGTDFSQDHLDAYVWVWSQLSPRDTAYASSEIHAVRVDEATYETGDM
jgi:hypothetical protein